MKKYIFYALLSTLTLSATAQNWPTVTQECKPGTRWWWMGSAVNETDLRWNMQQYAKTGIGTLEITPLYGVQGNSRNELSFLSAPWMQALDFVEKEGAGDSIEIDMNTGTGWPFGGPSVTTKESACKMVCTRWEITSDGRKKTTINILPQRGIRPYTYLDRLVAYPDQGACISLNQSVADSLLTWKAPKGHWRIYAVYVSRTLQKVKRAAPGGEGYVIDHFDSAAVAHYLSRFTTAFKNNLTAYPHTFFNDSYEVYGADWTPTLFDEFQKRRGYRLEEHLPELLGDVDDHNKVLIDFRETMSELLIHNFTEQWTAWAHAHGAITRNQAHGSPSNLIDTYAAVDIPEIEGFGLSPFHIKGLRDDEGFTRKNFSDFTMLKYASSASHITGKQFTSSETFTWLTEHFRTSLSQCKPDLDLMFVSGVNHVFFHGTCYSPQNDPWPGWKFYASIDMSPTNSIWHDAPYFMQYITRCQSFLQWGQPDNDFLVYLPFRKMLSQRDGKNIIMQFDIHSMDKKAPEFIRSIQEIDSLGYDCDYISDQYLQTTTVVDGMLRTAAGTRYKALLIPDSTYMPQSVRQRIQALQQAGANISYGYSEALMRQAAVAEQMKTRYHLKAIRRKNDKGYHYFISNLSDHDVSGNIALSVKYKDAMFFDPLTGARHAAYIHDDSIALSLHSGESVILETFDRPTATGIMQKPFRYLHPKTISGKWKLAFTDSHPQVKETFVMDTLHTWETLADDSVQETMGTGSYTTTFMMSSKEIKSCRQWAIDLGDVRESARVWINGRYIGCAWCLPYILDCQDALHAGRNTLRIDVTNLPANRIAAMDRKGIKWRKFNEINIVDLNYKKTTYEHWAPVKSGLNSNVTLYQLHP